MQQQNMPELKVLTEQLDHLMTQYRDTLQRDEIFEVRKSILLKIKELEKQIDLINRQP